jgi:ATP-binding cassette subfamily A (ABC1) protein 1
LVTLGLLYPVAAMISYIVREKELRQKELMKIMSVTESDIGQSWFVNYLIYGLIAASATAGVSTPLYENSSHLYLWVFWVLTFLAVIVFSMYITTLSSVTTRAILIGLLVFFIGVFLTLAVDSQTGNPALIAVISLHPVAAFSYGLQQIGRLEDLGIGLQPSSVGVSDSPSGYTFNSSLFALIIDSILWGVGTFYLNRVIPPAYGQALPWYFPFSRDYWCPGRALTPKSDDTDKNETDVIGPFEPVGNNLLRQKTEGKSIEIRHMCKVFGGKTAVDRLSLSMYTGQITVLLGHNGK